jgi:hypothetical protein
MLLLGKYRGNTQFFGHDALGNAPPGSWRYSRNAERAPDTLKKAQIILETLWIILKGTVVPVSLSVSSKRGRNCLLFIYSHQSTPVLSTIG